MCTIHDVQPARHKPESPSDHTGTSRWWDCIAGFGNLYTRSSHLEEAYLCVLSGRRHFYISYKEEQTACTWSRSTTQSVTATAPAPISAPRQCFPWTMARPIPWTWATASTALPVWRTARRRPSRSTRCKHSTITLHFQTAGITSPSFFYASRQNSNFLRIVSRPA